MSQNVLTVYGADWCRDCLRTRRQKDIRLFGHSVGVRLAG
ncbi:Uncharacterised protein [Micrococcus luteus]|nr:Uncharacterised protein [Micrococcus luteus]